MIDADIAPRNLSKRTYKSIDQTLSSCYDDIF